MTEYSRRDAIGVAAGSLLGLAACYPPTPPGTKSIKWRLASAWPKTSHILAEAPKKFAALVETASQGRLTIEVFDDGELASGPDIFSKLSAGSFEASHGASYYWAQQIPSASFFSSIPFGLNCQLMDTWLARGGGSALWNKLYQPFKVIPFSMGNTGIQMGGWYMKQIRRVSDLAGMRVRMPGLGGEVLKLAGARVQSVPGDKIVKMMKAGELDAAEWVGPYADYLLQIHSVCPNYYFPGWHEPGVNMELAIREEAFLSLSPDLRLIIESCAAVVHQWVLQSFEAKNNEYLGLIERQGVRILEFPTEVLDNLASLTRKVISDIIIKDMIAEEIHSSFSKFRASVMGWVRVSESAYYSEILKREDRSRV